MKCSTCPDQATHDQLVEGPTSEYARAHGAQPGVVAILEDPEFQRTVNDLLGESIAKANPVYVPPAPLTLDKVRSAIRGLGKRRI